MEPEVKPSVEVTSAPSSEIPYNQSNTTKTQTPQENGEGESKAVAEENIALESGTTATTNGGEGSEGSGTKKRNRNRDDLTLSPDLAKTGKRQRKVNSIYSDFAMDKVIGQEQGAPPTQGALPPSPIIPVNKKEFIMTPQAAQEKARKLPKGYAFEPIALPKVTPEKGPLPPKRERKKTALTDFVESPAAVPKGQKGTKGKEKGEKKDKKASKRKNKKHQGLDSVAAAKLKKQQLENQLNVLTQQLAAVSQTLEHQGKGAQQIEGLTNIGSDVKSKVKATPKAKAKAKRTSIYDKFESDEDVPVAKKAKTKQTKKEASHSKKNSSSSSSSGRNQRNRKKSTLEGSDSEPRGASILSGPLKQCHKTLQNLMKHQFAWPFNKPVDPVALNIPDYFDIIKHPMDFGTILENIESGDYTCVEDFAEDVRLVFKNAFTYNQVGSDICIMATTLQELFEKRILKLIPSPQVPIPEGGRKKASEEEETKKKNLVKAEMTSTINELRDSMKFVRDEIQKLKKEKAATTTPASTKATKLSGKQKEDAREMTFEEKRDLSVNINNLPPENLGKVVQIIHQRMPNLAQNSPDEIEIDIDALDAGTLRALERYVKTCLTRKKKKPVSNSKVAQAELASQNTSKSIDDVKKKLKELSSKSESYEKKRKKKKEGEENEDVDIEDDTPSRTYPSVVIEKDKESSSSSSSSSSSDSSESSSSASETESEKEKKAATKPSTTETTEMPLPSDTKPAQEQRDNSLPTSDTKEGSSSALSTVQEAKPKTDQSSAEPQPKPLQIVQPTAQKEVELKNLDAWKMEGATSEESSSKPQMADETWSQFQKADLQNKMREKERQEREEKERQERARKDQERKQQEEQRLKQIFEEEERKKQKEEEAKAAAQRELAEKREAEKRAREQETADVDMLGQSVVMSSFERDLRAGSFESEEGQEEPILDILKLKDTKQE